MIKTSSRLLISLETNLFADLEADKRRARISSLVGEMVALKSAGLELIVVTAGWSETGSRVGLKFDDIIVEDIRRNKLQTKSTVKRRILTCLDQHEYSHTFIESFAGAGRPCSQFNVCRNDLADQSRYENFRVLVHSLLKNDIVPLISTLDLFSTSDEMSDGQMACILSSVFQVSCMVCLSSSNGITGAADNADGGEIIPVIEDVAEFWSKALESGVTFSKLDQIRLDSARLLTSFGIEMHIVNGHRDGVLTNLAMDEAVVGTRILARGAKLKQRKSWVGLAASSKGEVIVSTFLAEALKAGKPASVLLIGVEEIRGTFQKQDVVTVKNLSGDILGRGEVRMSSEEIISRKLLVPSNPSANLSGIEVIHCDYYVHAPDIR